MLSFPGSTRALGFFAVVTATMTLAAAEGLDSSRIPALIQDLSAADPQVRADTADELGSFGAEAREAVPGLIRMLADDSTYTPKFSATTKLNVYDEAFRTLIEIGTESVAGLTGALDDPSAAVRSRAVQALGRIGVRARSALPELTGLAADRDLGVRMSVVKALSAIDERGDAAIPILIDRLQDDDELVRADAADALGHYRQASGRSVVTLLPLLKSNSAVVRGHVARALGSIGESPNEVLPALIALFEDRAKYWDCSECPGVGANCMERTVATQAVRAMAGFATDPKIPLTTLLKLLEAEASAEDPFEDAAFVIESLGPAAKPLVPRLAAILDEGRLEPERQVRILTVLRKLGRHADAAVPTLRALFQRPVGARADGDVPDLQLPAACALVSIDFSANKDAREILLARLGAYEGIGERRLGYDEAAATLLEIIGSLGPRAARAVPTLAKLLEERLEAGDSIHQQIAAALGQIGPDAAPAIPALVRQLGSTYFETEETSTRPLVGVGPTAVPELTRGLENFAEDKHHCIAILHVLGNLGEGARPAIATVVRIAREDGRRDVRLAATKALGGIAAPEPTVVRELIRLLEDERPAIRAQAALSLGTLRATASPARMALTKALDDAYVDVRVAAAKALAQ